MKRRFRPIIWIFRQLSAKPPTSRKMYFAVAPVLLYHASVRKARAWTACYFAHPKGASKTGTPLARAGESRWIVKACGQNGFSRAVL